MSFALDVNILLYASDASSALHAEALAFLQSVALGDEVCYLAWPTVMGYLRIATHPRIFAKPLSPTEAQGNIDRLLTRPHVRCIGEADGFWGIYRNLTRDVPARGNLIPTPTLPRSSSSTTSAGSTPAIGISRASLSSTSSIRLPLADTLAKGCDRRQSAAADRQPVARHPAACHP